MNCDRRPPVASAAMSTRAGQWRDARVRRMVFHPVVALVLGVVLLADVWYWGTYRHRHTALLAAPCCVLSLGRTYRPRIPRAVIVEGEDGLRILDIYSDEGYALSTAQAPPPELRGWATAWPMLSSYGLLAPVVSRRGQTLHAYSRDPDRPLSDEELAVVRAEYCRFLRTWEGGYLAGTGYIEALAAGDGTWRRLSWPAALHDLAAVAVLVLVVVGLRRGVRELKERRRRIAIERDHLCPHCGYDITGIRDRCPECGEDIGTRPGGVVHLESPSDPVP